MMEVVWLKEYTEGLKEVGRHNTQDSPPTTYQVLIKIKTSGDSLQHNPELGSFGRVKKKQGSLLLQAYPKPFPTKLRKNKSVF
jgi:hypothetical protein